MDISIILIALGLIAIIAFLKQFGLLSGKGVVFAIAGVALFFGFSVFQSYRKKKVEKDFAEREKKLKEQEKMLKKLEEEIELSDKQVQEAEAALISEKAAHKKKKAHIEAEKDKKIKERKAEINNMSAVELLENF